MAQNQAYLFLVFSLTGVVIGVLFDFFRILRRSIKTSNTIISKEYPVEWNVNCEPYYPINDDRNTKLYNQYYELSKQEYNVHFGGRLGQYKYYNMDDVILDALSYIKSLF